MRGIGRLYSVEFKAVAVSVQQDLFYLKPAADKIIWIESCQLFNVGGTADAGDAQEEFLDVSLRYVPATVTASSGGNSYTPQPQAINDSAAGFTARINDTTKATSSGTIVGRGAFGWNVRGDFTYYPAPEHIVVVANAAALTVRLDTTPADAITVSGVCLVRELP